MRGRCSRSFALRGKEPKKKIEFECLQQRRLRETNRLLFFFFLLDEIFFGDEGCGILFVF